MHRALVVDDTRTIRAAGKKMLQRMGLPPPWQMQEQVTLFRDRYEHVDEATDGDEGLEAMKQRWYDCVLCDINMPRMDGLECVALLRAWEAEHRPHLRQLVLCVTGEDGRSEEEILSAGMDRVLRKPITWVKVEQVTPWPSRSGGKLMRERREGTGRQHGESRR